MFVLLKQVSKIWILNHQITYLIRPFTEFFQCWKTKENFALLQSKSLPVVRAQRCQMSRFWRDVPIFESDLNVPRGTGLGTAFREVLQHRFWTTVWGVGHGVSSSMVLSNLKIPNASKEEFSSKINFPRNFQDGSASMWQCQNSSKWASRETHRFWRVPTSLLPMCRRLAGTRQLCVLVDTYQGIKAPRELKRLEGLGTTSACHYAVAKAPIS